MCTARMSPWLIGFWVMSLASNSFEEVVLIQGADNYPTKEVACVAEDDGSALALNLHLESPSESVGIHPIPNSPVTIGIDRSTKDYMEYWKFTTSFQHLMGPVFDYRWEGFQEYSVGIKNQMQYQGYQSVVTSGPGSGTILFSVRGLGNIHILRCKPHSSPNYSCSQSIITSSSYETSASSYAKQIFAVIKYSEDCRKENSYAELNQPLISEYEWRTFILKWEQGLITIQAHNSNCKFVTEETNVYSDSKIDIFLGTSGPGRLRFHFYNYTRTTKEDVKLYTNLFYHEEQILCIELLISVCPECELDVEVFSHKSRDKWTIGRISGNRKSAPGKLPTWRFEKLNATLRTFVPAYLRLEISTQKNSTTVQGLWAIDHFRKCRPVDAIKISSSFISKIWVDAKNVFPTIGCQKLFHSENIVVTTGARNTHNISSDLLESLRRKIRPTLNYKPDDWYRLKSFCDRTGCTCAPGFNGSDCGTACLDGTYGYACREACGQCQFGTCEKISGFCTGNCIDYHLPPYCKTKLEVPTMSYTDQRTAMLHLPRSEELNVAKIRDFHFQLKTRDEDWIVLETKSSNLPMVTIQICGLLSGTQYTVRAVMQAQKGDGDWVSATSPEANYSTSNGVQPAVANTAPCLISACNTDDENPAPNLSCTQSQASINSLDLKVISQGKGSVTLKLDHPPYTCGQISRFEISIAFVKTKLQNDPSQQLPILKNYFLTDHQQEYSMDFNLPTSTCYNLSVTSVTAYGPKKVANTLFQVPSSVGFDNGEAPEVSFHGTFIKLKVRAVVNATRNSHMLVVVKGSPPCKYLELSKNLRKLVNMTDSEPGWIARNLTIQENSPQTLTIGENSTNATSEACPLSPTETYVVVVVLEVSQFEMIAIATSSLKRESKEEAKKSIVWIVILLILMICLFLLFVCRRQFWKTMMRMRRKQLVSYSQAVTDFVKATTTCTFQQPPPMPASPDPEQFGSVSTSAAVAWSRHSHSVNIEDFEEYVKDSISSGLLESQFVMFPRGLIRPSKYGSLPENKPKNRYPNIVAYDETRVVLEKIPNDRHSDYINANYVQSIDKKCSYIAVQGPKPQTVVDFWRMIWQEKSLIICMLTNLVEGQKVKCEQYWPEFGEKKTYGDIVVVTEKHDVFADYTFRTFRVSCKEESRRIEHMHFTGWPDHSVPMYSNSVIKYLKKLQAISTGKEPIVVHCSAGIGRTGTIILCDICSRQADARGTVDVLAEFKKLRDCRMNLVDSEIQYLFAHVVLVEFIVYMPTELNCNNDLPRAIKEMKKKLPQHMERLRNIVWQDQALQFRLSPRSPLPEQLAKNRFPELAPVCSDLVYLKRYPTHDNSSDYINAIVVDGARAKRQYLASQLPLPSTLSDFWRLVAEQRIQLVIVLQSPDLHDPTCCDIIPGEKRLNPVPFINVELKASSGPENPPRAVELILTDTSEGAQRTQRVNVLTCVEWGLGKGGKPPPPNELVELWTASEHVHREEGPTLVLCHDGVTGCGLYLALSFLLERMAVEQECDVIFAVRAIRRSRPDFVQSQEQFEYLYDAATNYIESFETYANFI